LPGFEAIAWWGLSVPAKTDPAIVTLLNSKLNAQLHVPELVTRLEELGVHAEPSTPDAFATFVERETRKWQEVVAKTGTSIQ
jgi:tripartite-type tricarboxylate transporter receptor subunit TctC